MNSEKMKAQGARCPCGGSDDYCPCQNVDKNDRQQESVMNDPMREALIKAREFDEEGRFWSARFRADVEHLLRTETALEQPKAAEAEANEIGT